MIRTPSRGSHLHQEGSQNMMTSQRIINSEMRFMNYKMCSRLNLCSSSSLCKELRCYYYFLTFIRLFSETWHYTANVYWRIKWRQSLNTRNVTHLAEYGGTARFDFIKVCIGKTVIDMCNCNILAIKLTYLNALLFFLMSSRFSARSEACSLTRIDSQKRP